MSNCTKGIYPTRIPVEIYRHTFENPWTYSSLTGRQSQIADRVGRGGVGSLIVSELAPVITVSRRTPDSDLLFTSTQLMESGIEVCLTDRGGLATYHGPGQWVLFPVDRIEVFTGDPRGVKLVVEALLETALEVGRPYCARAEIRSGCHLGVWTPQGKVASVGVQIRNGVLQYGFSVNGFRTSQSFLGLRPCGQEASLAYLLEKPSELAFLRLRDQLVTTALRNLWNVRPELEREKQNSTFPGEQRLTGQPERTIKIPATSFTL